MLTKNSQTQEILKKKYIKKTASRKFRKYKGYDMQFSNSSLYKKTYGVMWECW